MIRAILVGSQSLLLAFLLVSESPAQAPRKEALAGAQNYTRVSATVGCSGATTPDVVPELKRQGYKAIVNFRMASESGANVEAEQAAAQAAGLKYIHLPFSGASPDPAVVAAFLQAVADPANQPVFIHCASGNRVGAMWLVKRMLQDGWDEQKAVAEAETIGLSSSSLKEFALSYVKTHGK